MKCEAFFLHHQVNHTSSFMTPITIEPSTLRIDHHARGLLLMKQTRKTIPTTFILSSNGTELFKKVGMLTKSQLEAAIEDAL